MRLTNRTAWLWKIITNNGRDHQHFSNRGSLSVRLVGSPELTLLLGPHDLLSLLSAAWEEELDRLCAQGDQGVRGKLLLQSCTAVQTVI